MKERMSPCCHTALSDGPGAALGGKPDAKPSACRRLRRPVGRSRLVGMTSSETLAGGIRPRPVVGRLPRYAAGKPPVAVDGLVSYKLSSNENPLPPHPRRPGGHRTPDRLQPLSGSPQQQAPRCARRVPGRPGGGHRHRRRQPRRPQPAADHVRRPERRRQGGRGDLRVAVLRGVPHQRRPGRGRKRPDPPDGGRPPRPGRHGGGRHGPHQSHPAVHPQQPHRSHPDNGGNRTVHPGRPVRRRGGHR